MSETVFRLARFGEDQKIIAFINEHFDMHLPLINLPEFYKHYYVGRNGVPQFAIAEQDSEYLSVAGYILANTSRTPDVWVSVWVAAKGHNGVGLELMNALPELTHARVLACNNIRSNTCTFYQFLGWQAERMHHYYRLKAPGPDGYRLALPLQPVILPVKGLLSLTKVTDPSELIPLGLPPTVHTPTKDIWYLRRRYFRYPHLNYDFWKAELNGKLVCYVVTRTVTAQETGCVPVVRLVDYIGPDEALPLLGSAFDRLLQSTGAEYIDCYNVGIPPQIWKAAGFCERLPDDGTIIPNYLTPPLRENTEYYYFTNAPERFVMFKADGDQDRPNLG